METGSRLRGALRSIGLATSVGMVYVGSDSDGGRVLEIGARLLGLERELERVGADLNSISCFLTARSKVSFFD